MGAQCVHVSCSLTAWPRARATRSSPSATRWSTASSSSSTSPTARCSCWGLHRARAFQLRRRGLLGWRRAPPSCGRLPDRHPAAAGGGWPGALRLPAAAQRAPAAPAHHRPGPGSPSSSSLGVLPGQLAVWASPAVPGEPPQDAGATHPAPVGLHARRGRSADVHPRLVRRSRRRRGRAMRATAAGPDTARLMGINVDRIIVLDVHHRLRPGRRGRRARRPAHRPDQLLHGLPGRPEGLHRRRAGRHRQHRRGRARRPTCSASSRRSASYYWAGQWQDVFAFALLITLLVLRPTGLLGERVAG